MNNETLLGTYMGRINPIIQLLLLLCCVVLCCVVLCCVVLCCVVLRCVVLCCVVLCCVVLCCVVLCVVALSYCCVVLCCVVSRRDRFVVLCCELHDVLVCFGDHAETITHQQRTIVCLTHNKTQFAALLRLLRTHKLRCVHTPPHIQQQWWTSLT